MFVFTGESILAMTCDEAGDFLITGDTQGYVKVWDISEYCIADKPSGMLPLQFLLPEAS